MSLQIVQLLVGVGVQEWLTVCTNPGGPPRGGFGIGDGVGVDEGRVIVFSFVVGFRRG